MSRFQNCCMTGYLFVIRKDDAESVKKKERSFMNNQLRYLIIKDNADKNNGVCKCELCGRTIDDGISFHVDHIVPIVGNGKTVTQNLRVLCNECNNGKGSSSDRNITLENIFSNL